MASRAASAEYQPRCYTARKFCLLCWLLSEKLVGFEMGNVVNEYHYSSDTGCYGGRGQFLYVKIILQDGTKSDQDITWLRRSRSKEIQKKSISTES